jgi:hypothetical protein
MAWHGIETLFNENQPSDSKAIKLNTHTQFPKKHWELKRGPVV